MLKKILQKDEKVLREIAKEVPIQNIKTAKIKKVLKEMSEALKSQDDGVAIAAPQIGYSLRIFIVSGKIFRADFPGRGVSKNNQNGEQGSSATPLGVNSDPVKGNSDLKNLIFINPKISKLSREKEWVPECCLSVVPLYGKSFRAKKATVAAYDENGKKFIRGASGLLAQIFQHETDHLNGILFIDHAKDVKAEEPK